MDPNGFERAGNAGGQFYRLKSRRTINLGLILVLGGLALGALGVALLLRPAEYQATARIKVEPDVTDVTNQEGEAWMGDDLYFAQIITFEDIQSELVLSNVINNLDLDMVWGAKSVDGGKLTFDKALARLKAGLKLKPVTNTRLINISYTSNDPVEAAKIANAMVEAYRDYHLHTQRQLITNGLAAMQREYQDEETQMEVLRTGAERIRLQLGIPRDDTNMPASPPPEQQPYWSERQKLDQLTEQHKLLGLKIDAARVDDMPPRYSVVEIVDPAVPPARPIGPNRVWGELAFALGFLLCFKGGLMIRRGYE